MLKNAVPPQFHLSNSPNSFRLSICAHISSQYSNTVSPQISHRRYVATSSGQALTSHLNPSRSSNVNELSLSILVLTVKTIALVCSNLIKVCRSRRTTIHSLSNLPGGLGTGNIALGVWMKRERWERRSVVGGRVWMK